MNSALPRAVCCLLVSAAFTACSDEPVSVTSDDTSGSVAQPEVMDAEYVGSAACSGCHSEQTALWQRSHHAHAMANANADTVLGDFDAARFDYGPYFAEFFIRDGRYWVRTNDLPRQADPTATEVAEFEVLYTFGVGEIAISISGEKSLI